MKINFHRVVLCIALLGCMAAQPASQPIGEFQRALGPREWSFPRDHGRHDGFKLEWWYFTGNLHDSAGHQFGYQLTFFRSAFAPDHISRTSPWGMTDVYFAHAAISDIAGKRFVFKDRVQRARPGLAMASDQKLDVSLLDWSGRLDGSTIKLKTVENDFAIDLQCVDGRGPVLQGPGGVNAKGREPGEASYYYSMTRLKTTGQLAINGNTYHVDGLSWMDHEFSTDSMAKELLGWDWMGLQLNDGSDLMIYRMRSKTGTSDYLSGTRIMPDGTPHYLSQDQIKIAGDSAWTSPASGAQYPQRWSITIPDHSRLIVTSEMPGQELITKSSTKVTYFEGAARVTDESGQPAGEGYLEMTGYAHAND